MDVKNDFNRGPGLWKFNNTPLEDSNYRELIVLYYPQILRKDSEVNVRYIGQNIRLLNDIMEYRH